ncbi:hypothetical protein GCM10010245_90280 [Streptomyces spectabilis]|nr:hypothetical protein GCM10010245_90280 [Streptomyces spectabilis]
MFGLYAPVALEPGLLSNPGSIFYMNRTAAGRQFVFTGSHSDISRAGLLCWRSILKGGSALVAERPIGIALQSARYGPCGAKTARAAGEL